MDLLVLVDMDGVLADFTGGWVKEWNKKHPDNLANIDHADAFELEKSFGGIASEEEIIEIFYQPGFFYNLEPIPGAIEAFHQMHNCGIELFICTAPSGNNSFMEKADWVEHYLGKEWVKKMIITKDKTLVYGDYLIDDKPNITGIMEPQWEQILYAQQYNIDNNEKKLFSITWDVWPRLLMYHDSKRR